MEIVLNGERREIEPGTTVADVLASLGVPEDGVAVAVDTEVVPKSAHGSTELRDGARLHFASLPGRFVLLSTMLRAIQKARLIRR